MKTEYYLIHRAIHDREKETVMINEVELPIKKSYNGCRYVDYVDEQDGKIRFMEQNMAKNSQYAKRAREGENITWGIRDGNWILIDAARVNKFITEAGKLPRA